MLLAIDVGNTNCKFAVFDGEKMLDQWRIQTAHARTADEYAVWLTQLMALRGIQPRQIEGAIIATVVPQVLFNIRQLCVRYFSVEPLVVGEDNVDLGVQILLDRPQDAGADRVVNAIAAFKEFGGPLIIIDFGSGTTFDVVDDHGNYCGGAIAPGIQLSIEAFYLMTARLPRIRVEKPSQVIGKATIPAMQSGIFFGYIGLVEKLVGLIKAEYGKPMKVIATGGLAPLFEKETPVIEAVTADLTMRGLQIIYARNSQSAPRPR